MDNKEYIEGEMYELGKYVGIRKVYPWNVSYYKLVHKFVKEPENYDGRQAFTINEIEIERIER